MDHNDLVNKVMERPTYQEMKDHIKETLAGYVTKPQIWPYIVERPTFIQTEGFMKQNLAAQHDALNTHLKALTADIQHAVLQVDEASKGVERNIEHVKLVENAFQSHVATSFSKLEGAVADLRATTTTTTAADCHDDRRCSGPLGPREGGHRPGGPTGKPAVPPGIQVGSSRDDDCVAVSGHLKVPEISKLLDAMGDALIDATALINDTSEPAREEILEHETEGIAGANISNL